MTRINKKKKVNEFFRALPRYIFYIITAIILILPFFWMLSTSFKLDIEIFTFPIQWLPSSLYLGNYKRALEIMPVLKNIMNTTFVGVLKLLGEVLVSALVAYGFARFEFKFKKAIFMVLIASLMLPYEVTMIPTFIMWSKLGFADSYVPLILPSLFGSASFIFFFRMYFSTFPSELEDAMLIDGANRFQIFYLLYLPLSKAALITVTVWSFLGTWNDLLGPLIYLNDSNKYTVQLSLAAFSNMTGETLWGPLMAANVMVLTPILILYLLAQNYFIDGVRAGSIKG